MSARLMAFVALTGLSALPAPAPADAAARVVSAHGVIARVVVDECVQPPSIAWRACRSH